MSVDPKTGRRALGRGLDALFPAATTPTTAGYGEKGVFTCGIERLVPQPGQPRHHFEEAELEQLTASVREKGVIIPILVRRAQGQGADGKFEIIAGERRWRAAQRAGLRDVLVVVKDVSPSEAFELALVENIQRSDLNPIEVAEAYDRLLREHAYTHEALASRVGKDRTTVANALRLLKLPAKVRDAVLRRELSEGHARAILGAPSDKAMLDIADQAARGKLPVRKVEALVREARVKEQGGGKPKTSEPDKISSPGVRDLEERLRKRLGTRVEVRDANGKGELAISYASLDELDRLLAIFGVS